MSAKEKQLIPKLHKGYQYSVIIILAFSILVFCKKEEDPVHTPTPPTGFQVDTLATGLSNPWGMVFIDGGILYTERSGSFHYYKEGQRQQVPLSISRFASPGQGGLLGVTLHPDFSQNGWVYFVHSGQKGSGTATFLARATWSGGSLSNYELLYEGNDSRNSNVHFGSRVAFDNDGYVYFTIGDRGAQNSAQDVTNNFGTVLRLNDDGSIPGDNPFVNSPDTLNEIWSYGHRNPQGLVMRPGTGQLWSHEHGPRGGDEINLIEKGKNYGWPLATHGVNYDGSPVSNDTVYPGTVQPVHHWTPSIAPCGMTFVHNSKLPQFDGNMLVGALVEQHIAHVYMSGNRVTKEERLLEGYARFRDVKQGPDGYIYILTEAPGMLLRLVPLK